MLAKAYLLLLHVGWSKLIDEKKTPNLLHYEKKVGSKNFVR